MPMKICPKFPENYKVSELIPIKFGLMTIYGCRMVDENNKKMCTCGKCFYRQIKREIKKRSRRKRVIKQVKTTIENMSKIQ